MRSESVTAVSIPPTVTLPGPQSIRVLLVEDSLDDAALLGRHLRRSGFQASITRIETAEAMHQELAEGVDPYDLILADYNLPLFSAPEALQMLKKSRRDIPFIMMSGAVSEDTAVAAMRAGAHDYVSKQNLTRLVPAIERELAEAAGRRNRLAAERALEQAEERFHRLVEGAPLPLLISDMRGSILYANAAAEQLLGFDRKAVDTGMLMLGQILPPDGGSSGMCQSAVEALVDISNRLRGETIERVCQSKHGEAIPVLVGAAILNPEVEPEARQVAAFLVDLSAQKRSEEVLRRTEKLAATGRLAASIAHEINNPLEAITNCLYLVANCQLSVETRRYLTLAQQELDRVTQITTQTLRFYRQSTRAVETDLAELLGNAISLYEPRLRSHSIVVERDFSPVPTVIVHDGEIRQVLVNLIGNALDAMTGGDERATGRLLLRLRATQDWRSGGDRIAIVVADSGTGMSRATLGRIYEPFFSTKGITGTGLGLWVSQGIIHKHCGEMRVRSRQSAPHGTVFRLTLPLSATAAADPTHPYLPALGS